MEAAPQPVQGAAGEDAEAAVALAAAVDPDALSAALYGSDGKLYRGRTQNPTSVGTFWSVPSMTCACVFCSRAVVCAPGGRSGRPSTAIGVYQDEFEQHGGDEFVNLDDLEDDQRVLDADGGGWADAHAHAHVSYDAFEVRRK